MIRENGSSPLAMQMKYFSSWGTRGLSIFEHHGETSNTWYENRAEVNKGVLKIHGVQVPEDPEFVAEHRDDTLSECTKDGVPVELIRKEFKEAMDPELIDAQMRNDEL